ncbi:class I SAM-dependent methyltransferase [Lysobacter korlensis]|uniref:Class I SAM-dependent methyltransferase n=1 Tax=Lysobacter korlensis TaxID=553636 RepID=A0ABV6RNB8_9GAMM
MGSRGVPARIRWAVERLPVELLSSVLEIGCGSGAAAQLVCDLLDPGTLTALDRSETAIRRTAERNPDHLASGRLRLVTGELASLDADVGAFDLAFAVNVNLFWTRDPAAELAVLDHVIRPGGTLHLFYDAGPAGTADKVLSPIRLAFDGTPFEQTRAIMDDTGYAISFRRL